MKRLALLAALAVLPGSLLAESSSRYLVATHHPAHGAISKDPVDTPRGENVRTFTALDGYAADLTAAEVAELRNAGVYVEPVAERHALDVETQPARDTAQTTPYGISLVRAPEAWPVVSGKGINVVVIDTGVDYNHPELKGIYQGGLNTFNDSNDPFDDNGHGTHCAGIVAAANNTQGVVGVAPDIKLWSVKVLDSTGSGSTENVVTALDWVLTKKAALGGDWVISLSLGSDKGTTFERNAFTRALDAGILAVAASGNESTSTSPAPVAFPAAYPGMMSVGAVDSSSRVASFSNQGVELSVVAPGVGVLSTLPTGTNYVGVVTTPKGTVDGAPLVGSKLGSLTSPYVYCNLGRPQDFPASVSGKIALIKRGDITFNEKTRNALKAGASAVVIFNKDNSALTFTLISSECDAAGQNCVDSAADKAFAWPITIAISQLDGEALAASTTGGNLTIATIADDYGVKSGTSMATPHVAGVAALVWSAALDAKSADVKSAIEQTAVDLGSAGRDTVYGFGLVDALSAAKQLAPQKFGVGATPEPAPAPSGRMFLKRGGH
ncbi:MAG TPA: S8 family serine peptidase [Thermoanaerobaculia bacterium]|nr:S8 family serine peptidase [Thermoanaerobaculia bacterium]